MLEIWRTAIYKGEPYEGFEVSNLGRILSLNYRCTGRAELRKPFQGKDGYLRVGISKNKKKENVLCSSFDCRDFLTKP